MAKFQIFPNPDSPHAEEVLVTLWDGEDRVEVEGDGLLADDLRHRALQASTARELLTGFSYFVIRQVDEL